MNKLQCFLCCQSFKQPSMCPHCSEVFCFKCIRSYLDQNYFCPSCGNHVIDLISCTRLIDQVKEKIKQSNIRKREAQQSLQCMIHNMPIKYQCTTCNENICSDCGLIESKHKDHTIKSLEVNLPFLIEKKMLEKIKQRINEKITHSKEQQKKYLLEQELLRSQIKYNKTKIYEYYEQLILKLEAESQAILTKLDENLSQCNRNIEQKKLLCIQLEKSLTENKKIEGNKIQVEKQLYEYLENNNYFPKFQLAEGESHQNRFIGSSSVFSFYDRKIHELSIMKQINPQYQNFTFELDYELNKDSQIVYSPIYQVFGYEWRLKLYPHGNAQTFGEHASIFLELINSPEALTTNLSKEYLFRMELLNLNMAGKSIIKEYNSKFSVGQCWGYAQFISLDQIADYLHDGKLLFVMGIRNTSYFDMCDNMKKYITRLQGQNKVLTELCQSYYMNRSEAQNSSNSSESSSQQILQYQGLQSQISSLEELEV